MAEAFTEYWLRGPVDKIPSLIQPVAHALLQARREIQEAMQHFPDNLLWIQPHGSASAGFHLQHLAGVLDRLFTYARNEQLSAEQLTYLEQEGKQQGTTTEKLVQHFSQQVDIALQQLSITNEQSLTEPRGVGRKQIPSTLIGLLFHAAEHTMRHTGQLLVTSNFVRHIT